MNKERNKKLGVEKVAKRKALLCTLIILIVLIVCLYLSDLLTSTKSHDIVVIVFTVTVSMIICFFSYKFLYVSIESDEKYKEDKELIDKYMEGYHSRKVNPINADKHKEFILGLKDIAEFLTTRSDEYEDMLDVYVRFKNEDEGRFLERIYKRDFLKYYSIVENEEESKKEES